MADHFTFEKSRLFSVPPGHMGLAARSGAISGVSAWSLTCYNSAVINAVETLWPESTRYTTWLSVDTAMTISSANAADTSAGTGAQTVQVTGVQSNGTEVVMTATLNGTTAVSLPTSIIAVNTLRVLTVGTGGTNAGIIYVGTGTLTAGKPAVVHGSIAASAGTSQSGIYTVPTGSTLFINGICPHTHTAAGEFTIRSRDSLTSPWVEILRVSALTAGPYMTTEHLNPLGPLSQIELTGIQSTATARPMGAVIVGYRRS